MAVISLCFFQEASSSRSQSSEPKSEHQPIEVAVVSRNESEPMEVREERPQKPDHDAYPSLPGTPEPHIPEMSHVQQTKRKSLPPDLPSKRPKEEVNSLYLN